MLWLNQPDGQVLQWEQTHPSANLNLLTLVSFAAGVRRAAAAASLSERAIRADSSQVMPNCSLVHPVLFLFVWHVWIPWELGQHPLRCCCCGGRSLKLVGGTTVLISNISCSVQGFSAQQSTWPKICSLISTLNLYYSFKETNCAVVYFKQIINLRKKSYLA